MKSIRHDIITTIKLCNTFVVFYSDHRSRQAPPARPCTIGLPWPPWSPPRPSWQNKLTMTSRFLWALGVYAALALMATFTLDGKLRAAVWILLGGLTVKTCIAYKAGW